MRPQLTRTARTLATGIAAAVVGAVLTSSPALADPAATSVQSKPGPSYTLVQPGPSYTRGQPAPSYKPADPFSAPDPG